MADVYDEITRIEKAIAEVRIQHSLNKITTKRAKIQIRDLTQELQAVLMQLPDSERKIYLLEKRHGIGA